MRRAVVCLLLVLFAIGGGLLLQRLPGFRLFQLPVRMLLIAALPVALLAGSTVQALLDLPAEAGAASKARSRSRAAAGNSPRAMCSRAFNKRPTHSRGSPKIKGVSLPSNTPARKASQLITG